MATPADELLAVRLGRTSAALRDAEGIDTNSEAQRVAKQALIESIKKQKNVMLNEQRVRNSYNMQNKALNELAEHETLKRRLRDAQSRRTLTQRERNEYQASRERCRRALNQAGVTAADPLDTRSAPAQLRQKKQELKSALKTS